MYGVEDGIWNRRTLFEYDLAGRVVGTTTQYLDTKKMQAYESVRYNDGKNTVESVTQSMFDENGAKLKTLAYEYTYGDPTKGEMPDALYELSMGGRTFWYSYDTLGRLTGKTARFPGRTATESYTYKASKNSGYTTPIVETMTDFSDVVHTYTYDANGNITSETVGGQTIQYRYDSQNRLTHYFDPIANVTEVYTYDDRGNILKVGRNMYISPEELAQYGEDSLPSTTYTYGNSTWADLLTNYNGTAITYDEIGNPLTWVGGRNITLTWENGRNLAQYKQGNVRQYDYEYNADGLRTKKTITQSGNVTKNTEYYIINGQYIGESTTIGGTTYLISYFYDESGAPAGIYVNDAVYYFVKNLQGDVVAIVDYTGTVVAKYTYDAWGNIVAITDGDGASVSSTHVARLNPFRYRGYMYDEETGFYYLRSRYYDPSVGRFINADELIQSDLNESSLYMYGKSNPIKYGDNGGYDAVVLYNEDEITHIGILIEDEDGNWYHFYWGAHKDANKFKLILTQHVKVKAKLELCNFDVVDNDAITLNNVNNSGLYNNDYDYMVYLQGDFSESLNYCAEIVQKYNNKNEYSITKNNCSQVSLYILSVSETLYSEVLDDASELIMPSNSFKKVQTLKKKGGPIGNYRPIPIVQ